MCCHHFGDFSSEELEHRPRPSPCRAVATIMDEALVIQGLRFTERPPVHVEEGAARQQQRSCAYINCLSRPSESPSQALAPSIFLLGREIRCLLSLEMECPQICQYFAGREAMVAQLAKEIVS